MPNECDNQISFEGDKSEIDEFIKLVFDEESHNTHRFINCKGMLQKIVTFPNKKVSELLLREIFKGNYIGYDAELDKSSIFFKTKWGANDTPILYLSYLFPNIKFTYVYDEPNEGFEGESIFKNGKVISDTVIDFASSTPTLMIHKMNHKTVEDIKNEYQSLFDSYPSAKIEFCEERLY